MLARLTVTLLGAMIGFGLTAGCAGARKHKRHRHAPVAGVTTHVDTWALDDGCNGGAGAGPSLVRQWVTFAESNCGPKATKARTDCHATGRTYCAVMQYLDTNWDFSSDPVKVAHVASSDWWLHAPLPTPAAGIPSGIPGAGSLAGQATHVLDGIYTTTTGGGYLMNQLVPGVRAFFQSYVRVHYNSDDGLLMDWQSPSLSQELFYSTCGCSSTREISSSEMLRAAHNQMAAAMTHRDGTPFLQADNALPPNPFLPQGLDMLNPAAGVNGWVAEGEPESGGVLDPYYSTLLDQMAYLTNRAGSFIVLLSYGHAGASYQQQSRRVQEATVLLGYSPGHVVDWANLEQGSENLAVWPEEGIVPAEPVQSMGAPGGQGCLAGGGVICSVGGHNGVQVAPGIYRRVFRACYRRAVPFGPCAAIVNTTGSPVVVRSRWLRGASFRHQITFVGGDVQSGGTIRTAGMPFTAGSSTLGARDAMILAG